METGARGGRDSQPSAVQCGFCESVSERPGASVATRTGGGRVFLQDRGAPIAPVCALRLSVWPRRRDADGVVLVIRKR